MATKTSRPAVKTYPARKKCTGSCGRMRLIKFFRQLKSGYRQGMCVDCEREYERDRWHTRSDESRRNSGGTAARRRAGLPARRAA
jgi:hypothetical protein